MIINFYLLRTFCPHLSSFCVVSFFTTFRPNFTSGLLHKPRKEFRAKKKETERLRGFTEKLPRRSCMCSFQPSAPRSYFIHTYISGNKEKQEMKVIIPCIQHCKVQC